ncbi:MAG: MFS transporter [Isosphaeraceae bacterium]
MQNAADEGMASSPTPATDPAAPAPGVRRGAILALVVLGSMNLLDYMDRNILSAVLPQVQATFKLPDDAAGKLATCFLVSYSIMGPIMGWAADRLRRTYLLAGGVGVWAIATLGTGLAQDYNHLWYARCFLGIGEATYGVIAPTILMDLFSRQARSRVMSAFYLAMPLGTAVGMILGGQIAPIPADVRTAKLEQLLGSGFAQMTAPFESWQLAFFLVGIPALLSVVGAFLIEEPRRGASEGFDDRKLEAFDRQRPTQADYLDLSVNSSYTYTVLGLTAYTFAIGGLVFWFPSFLSSTRGFKQEEATLALGVITLIAAILGMSLGGWLADRLARKDVRALFLVPGIAMLLGLPAFILALFAKQQALVFAGIFVAETLMFVNTGPCSAIIGNVVQPNMRAVALAVAIAAQHFLGDIWSPWLIGLISDRFGTDAAMQSTIGQWLAAIGATPTPRADLPIGRNLLAGLLILVPAILLSSLVLISGARHLKREMSLMLAKMRAAKAPANG